jgi:peptide/nickel transport system ATP-binding protein
MEPLLHVQDLTTSFPTPDGPVHAVEGASFRVERGEIVGIVGESGCGKTTTALSILRLVPAPGRITAGRILFDVGDGPRDIVQLSDEEVRELRGSEISMIFQNPMTSLNPILTVGQQIREAMAAHRRFTPRQAGERVVPMLERVRMLAPRRHAASYPHQFSGGMRQRAMIAMGLSNEPRLLVADEPTASLDVTVQAQMIELLRDLNRETGTAIVLITHNLGVVAALCKRVIVMYAGQVVEQGTSRQVFKNPQHPYTWSLLRALPPPDRKGNSTLASIAGLPPDPRRPPSGCRFHPRCRFRVARCATEQPRLETVDAAQEARCWIPMRDAFAAQPEAAP